MAVDGRAQGLDLRARLSTHTNCQRAPHEISSHGFLDLELGPATLNAAILSFDSRHIMAATIVRVGPAAAVLRRSCGGIARPSRPNPKKLAGNEGDNVRLTR